MIKDRKHPVAHRALLFVVTLAQVSLLFWFFGTWAWLRNAVADGRVALLVAIVFSATLVLLWAATGRPTDEFRELNSEGPKLIGRTSGPQIHPLIRMLCGAMAIGAVCVVAVSMYFGSVVVRGIWLNPALLSHPDRSLLEGIGATMGLAIIGVVFFVLFGRLAFPISSRRPWALRNR